MDKRTADLRFGLAAVGLCLGFALVLTGCSAGDKALVLTSPGESQGQEKASEVQAEETQTSGEPKGSQTHSLYVHVCGAVQSSGLVELPEGSRVWNALEAAGGFGPDADRDYVNLASPVEDGQQLYFPTRAEAEALREADAAQEREQLAARSGLVNINTANLEQLCTLPGIGEARAQDIIDYREQNGAFREREDIMQVSGIKQSAYDKIRDKITVE